jgi:TetR/AcrR family transcriptional repressor of nem operon
VLADAAGANPRFRAELEARFGALETRIGDRLRHAAGPATDTGARTGAGDTQARALLIAAIIRGLMVRARAGADRKALERIAAEALPLLAPPRI